MIDKLKFLIDETEDNPKLKSILLKVAEMPENKQEMTLKLIEVMVNAQPQNPTRGEDEKENS